MKYSTRAETLGRVVAFPGAFVVAVGAEAGVAELAVVAVVAVVVVVAAVIAAAAARCLRVYFPDFRWPGHCTSSRGSSASHSRKS